MATRLVSIFLLAILIFSVCATVIWSSSSFQVASATEPITLAETLNSIISNVNWEYGNSWTTNWAIILADRGNSSFDEAVTADIGRGDYIDALYVARLAELNGFSSETLSDATQTALQQMLMCGSLPIIVNAHGYGDPDQLNSGCYSVYHRFVLWGYKYAEEYGLVDKWNVTQAFSDFAKAYDEKPISSVSGEMLWCDPEENWARSYSSRYYDEHAQTLSTFLKFAEQDIPNAMAYADSAWSGVQAHWNQQYGYYGYAGTTLVECEMGNFAQVIAEYKDQKGGTIPYWDRVISDLNYKLLANGWESPGWASPGVIVHASSNPQLRLWETLGATIALQSLFPYFDPGMKANWANMLMGSSPAWQGLIASDLNQDGYFSGMSGSGPSNDATACAAATLFLYGVVPVTGSVIIPNRNEFYNDLRTQFAASDFKFDYADRVVRIPVHAGKITFIYGATPVSYTFPTDGVYTIEFSDDWNHITAVNGQRIGSVALAGWKISSTYTNSEYTLSSTNDDLALTIQATELNSRVTIYTLNVPGLSLGDYDYLDVAISGGTNARVMLRFFLDDGSGFDVVPPWSDVSTLDASMLDLSSYSGRTITVVYFALKSFDGTPASVDLSQISFEMYATFDLTITTSVNGDTNPEPGVYQFTESSDASVSAVADAGFQFSHWLLDGAVVTGNPIAVNIDANHSLSAVFIPENQVALAGWHMNPRYTNAPYSLNYSSLHLELSAEDTASRVTIYTLNVPSVSLGDYDYVNVAATATSNARVMLRFFLDDGSGFDVVPPWSTVTTLDASMFDLSSYTGRTITVVYLALMSSDGELASVDISQISFEMYATFDLTIAASVNGDTSPGSGVHSYTEGSDVSVTATADTGYQLSHWMLDDVTVTGNPYVVNMNNDHTLTTVFIPENQVALADWHVNPRYTNAPYTLSYSSLHLELDAEDTDSRVTIYTLNVPGVSLGDFDYLDVAVSGTANARVMLRLFLDDGTGFDVVPPWSTVAALDDSMFDLTKYSGRTITVVYFALKSSDGTPASVDISQISFEMYATLDLTINASANGNTIPGSGVHSYTEASDVSVTAVPDAGYQLSHWLLNGVEVSFANPYVVNMDGNKTLVPVFIPENYVPLYGWVLNPSLTNAPYILDSSASSLSLELDAENASSRATIYSLNVPSVNLSGYDYLDVTVSGSGNAKVMLRFFLDDGSGFDVVPPWSDPATLNAINFGLSPYAGRTLTVVYIALMSSDESTASIGVTEIAFVA